MDKDYSKVSGTYVETVSADLRSLISSSDEVLDQALLSSPCEYHKVGKIFNLVDSAENDLLEINVSKQVTLFSGSDRVLFTYVRDHDEMPGIVISGNTVDGYCVFELNG